MTTLSTRLGLKKSTTADPYRIQEFADNFQRLDDHPGVYVCTSASRPSWGAAHAGMLISETDTGLLWRWDGTGFQRTGPTGHLGSTTRATDISTSSTTFVNAVSVTVTVPAGGRRCLLVAEGPGVYSTVGLTRVGVFRDATQLKSFLVKGSLGATAAEQPTPLFVTLVDTPAAGSIVYTLRFAAEVGFGGTSTMQAAANNGLSLRVVEV